MLEAYQVFEHHCTDYVCYAINEKTSESLVWLENLNETLESKGNISKWGYTISSHIKRTIDFAFLFFHEFTINYENNRHQLSRILFCSFMSSPLITKIADINCLAFYGWHVLFLILGTYVSNIYGSIGGWSGSVLECLTLIVHKPDLKLIFLLAFY